MLARIKGRIAGRKEGRIYLETDTLTYEILTPPIIFHKLKDYNLGDEINLVTTTYYLQEKNMMKPYLVGFLSDLEKEFFELFISISGFGLRGALHALNKPISRIAEAIENQDIDFLSSLPGVGQRKVYHILAKLRGKVSRFMLIPDKAMDTERKAEERMDEMSQEALQILVQLQYSRNEAKDLIKKVLSSGKKIESTEDLLNEIYRCR